MTKVRTALLPACLLGLALLLPGCTPSSASTPAEARASQTETAPLPTGRPRDAAENTADGDRATVMVYMVGSDLESESALGSLDLEEMARADLGERVSLVVQTMGCQEWHNAAVSPAKFSDILAFQVHICCALRHCPADACHIVHLRKYELIFVLVRLIDKKSIYA